LRNAERRFARMLENALEEAERARRGEEKREQQIGIALRERAKLTEQRRRSGTLADMPVWLAAEVVEVMKQRAARFKVPVHVLVAVAVDEYLKPPRR
jgi:hypothetical protein